MWILEYLCLILYGYICGLLLHLFSSFIMYEFSPQGIDSVSYSYVHLVVSCFSFLVLFPASLQYFCPESCFFCLKNFLQSRAARGQIQLLLIWKWKWKVSLRFRWCVGWSVELQALRSCHCCYFKCCSGPVLYFWWWQSGASDCRKR